MTQRKNQGVPRSTPLVVPGLARSGFVPAFTRRSFFTSFLVRSRDQRVELCTGLTMFSMKDLISFDPSFLYQVMAPACAFWCQHGF